MILVSQKGELVRLLKAGDHLRLVVFMPANMASHLGIFTGETVDFFRILCCWLLL